MLGKISIAIEAQIAKFESDLGRAARLAEKEAAAMKRAMNGAMTSFAAGLAGAVGGALTAQAAFDALWGSIERADKLDELSARLQISTEKLSGWGYAAQMSGSSLDDLAAAIPKLAKNLMAALDPKSSAAEVFDALGVKVTDATGKLREVEEVLPEIADKFKTLDDSTLEASLAMELFGKSGAGLLEFLNRGGDGIAEFEARAAELGMTVSGETAAAAAEFKDRLDDLHGVTQGLTTQLAADLLPELIKLEQWAVDFARDGTAAKNVADAIGRAFDVISPVVAVAVNKLDGLGDAVEGLAESFYGLGVAAKAALHMDVDGLQRALGVIKEGRGMILSGALRTAAFDPTWHAGQGAPPPVPGEDHDWGAAAPMSPAELSAYQRRLYGALGGGSRSSKPKGGKSDAQREAEQLAKQIESYNARLDEQIALFGKTGEAGKLAYEIQSGSLKKASEAQKAVLTEKAAWADWLDEMKAIDEATTDAARDQADAMQDQHDRTTAYLGDLQFELDLTRMSNREKEAAIEIRRAHADGIYGEDEAIRTYLDRIREAAEQQRLLDDVKGSAEDMFASFIDGSKSAGEAFEDFAKDLERIAARLLAQKAVEWIFGAITGTGMGGIWASGGPGYAVGGYTGPGGVNQPAGVVHKGEVVWSQADVARAGGVGVVEGMRRGYRGYADGGVVGGAAAAPGVTVIVENHSDSPARTEETTGSDGGRLIKVIVDRAVSEVDKRIGTMGSTGRAIASRFGVAPAGVSRG